MSTRDTSWLTPDVLDAIEAMLRDLTANRQVPRRRGRGKSRRSMDLVEAAYQILSEIQPATVRAVCYRLFTMHIIENMSKAATNRVSSQLTWAREHDLIPWDWIVDETREAERVSAWHDPAAYVETVKRAYRRDYWTEQPAWVEVWSEKGTIRGTLAPVLNEYGLTFRVMHGYGSSTALHQAAADSAAGTKLLTVLYVGDWDPSGLHMSEVDLPARLETYGGNVDIIRVALTKADTTHSSNLPYFEAATKAKDRIQRGSRYPRTRSYSATRSAASGIPSRPRGGSPVSARRLMACTSTI